MLMNVTSENSSTLAPGMPRSVPARHHVARNFHTRRVKCLLIGCGGNGARMLIRLATIDRALQALGGAGLRIDVLDGDAVEAHNCIRQPFSLADIGLPKACVLATRINAAHGTSIRAQPTFATEGLLLSEYGRGSYPDLIVSCVDTAQARAEIWGYLEKTPDCQTPHYWMDLGNAHRSAQFVIGTCRPGADVPLPTAVERWPEIVDPGQDDPAGQGDPALPSCSSADALAQQDLFINDMITCSASHLLWTMLRAPHITICGGFCNLETLRLVPIPVTGAPCGSYPCGAPSPQEADLKDGGVTEGAR